MALLLAAAPASCFLPKRPARALAPLPLMPSAALDIVE
jgi:hypothetical protein